MQRMFFNRPVPNQSLEGKSQQSHEGQAKGKKIRNRLARVMPKERRTEEEMQESCVGEREFSVGKFFFFYIFNISWGIGDPRRSRLSFPTIYR